MTDRKAKRDQSQQTPQQVKRSTTILLFAVSLSMMAYTFHIMRGFTAFRDLATAPTPEAQAAVTAQLRQRVLSDLDAISAMIARFNATVPEDPLAAFLYTYVVFWIIVLALAGLGIQWAEFSDWVNRDDVHELDDYDSGVSSRDGN